MKTMTFSRLVCGATACLFLTTTTTTLMVVPSVVVVSAAGLKGVTSSSAATARRRRRQLAKHSSGDDADASTSSADGEIKVRRAGPKKRDCHFSSKVDEVEFECQANADDLLEGGGSRSSLDPEDTGKDKEKDKDDKEESSKGGKDGKGISKEEEGSSLDEVDEGSSLDPSSRGIDVLSSEEESSSLSSLSLADRIKEKNSIDITPSNIKDKINYKVKTTKDGIQVTIDYQQEIETETSATETKTEFGIVFDRLVEYAKATPTTESGSRTGFFDPDEWAEDEIEAGTSTTTSSSEAYDWDVDEIIQEIPLTNWDKMTSVLDVANMAGVVASYFSATTQDGVSSFNFTVSRADQGERITANSIKIDVRIVNFPWIRSDSYVALLSTVESKKKVKMDYDENDDDTTATTSPAAAASRSGNAKKTKDVRIHFSSEEDDVNAMDSTLAQLGFTPFGEYTWADTAEVEEAMIDAPDNNDTIAVGGENDSTTSTIESTFHAPTKTTIQVVATSPPLLGNETFQTIAYSFVGAGAQSASEIYWDPQAGIGYESSPSSLEAASAGYESSEAAAAATSSSAAAGLGHYSGYKNVMITGFGSWLLFTMAVLFP